MILSAIDGLFLSDHEKLGFLLVAIDDFPSTQLRYRVFTTPSFQHNTDLLFC